MAPSASSRAASPKVICFRCRASSCACVAGHNRGLAERAALRGELVRALAWLGAACLAGTALGAGLALLIGG